MLAPEDTERHKTGMALVSESLHSCENTDKLVRNQPQWKCSDGGMAHCGSTSERKLNTTDKLFHYEYLSLLDGKNKHVLLRF